LVSGRNKEYSIAFGVMTKEKNPENHVDPVYPAKYRQISATHFARVQYKQKI
jgi:hypothetical protein